MEGVVKMDNNYLVDIQHERLSFFTPAGEVKALNDVSIHLKEGEVLGIVGESGSGKSVTAYSLMGLTAYPGKLIGGELHFNGHEVEKMTEKDFSKMRGKEVSIIFQDPLTSLNPVYTIGNQIMEVIRLHTDADKKKAYARAVELLSLVGINEPEKRMKQPAQRRQAQWISRQRTYIQPLIPGKRKTARKRRIWRSLRHGLTNWMKRMPSKKRHPQKK